MARTRTRPFQYKFLTDDGVRMEISTNSLNSPTTISYLTAKLKIEVENKQEEYAQIIKKIKDDVKLKIKGLIDYNMIEKSIINVNISDNTINTNNYTHITYEVFIKTNESLTQEEHKDLLYNLGEQINPFLIEEISIITKKK